MQMYLGENNETLNISGKLEEKPSEKFCTTIWTIIKKTM
jgi:hypothetical protein